MKRVVEKPLRRISHVRSVLRRWRQSLLAHVSATVGLLLVWIALWGEVTVPLVTVGLVLAVTVLLLFPLPSIDIAMHVRPWAAVVLVSRFVYDVVVASVQVSYLALRRRPPTTDVVTVALASDSDLIQHATSLAVSLVPGSLIIDADPQYRTLTIHVLYPKPQQPSIFVDIVLAQEHRIRAAMGDVPRGAPVGYPEGGAA